MTNRTMSITKFKIDFQKNFFYSKWLIKDYNLIDIVKIFFEFFRLVDNLPVSTRLEVQARDSNGNNEVFYDLGYQLGSENSNGEVITIR